MLPPSGKRRFLHPYHKLAVLAKRPKHSDLNLFQTKQVSGTVLPALLCPLPLCMAWSFLAGGVCLSSLAVSGCPSCKGNATVFTGHTYRTFPDKRVPVRRKTQVPYAISQHSEPVPDVLGLLLSSSARNKPAAFVLS